MADLVKTVELSKKAASLAKDTKLVNPDIPDSRRPGANREKTRDKFYSSMRLPSGARAGGGTGYSLARSGGLPGLDPRKQEFMLEGAIDPAAIRARHDPLNAPPNKYATGAEGYQYQLPLSTEESKSSVPLILKARASYAARSARLVALPVNYAKPAAVTAGKIMKEVADQAASSVMGKP